MHDETLIDLSESVDGLVAGEALGNPDWGDVGWYSEHDADATTRVAPPLDVPTPRMPTALPDDEVPDRPVPGEPIAAPDHAAAPPVGVDEGIGAEPDRDGPDRDERDDDEQNDDEQDDDEVDLAALVARVDEVDSPDDGRTT